MSRRSPVPASSLMVRFRPARSCAGAGGAPLPSCRTCAPPWKEQHDIARRKAFPRATGRIFQHGRSAEYDVVRDLARLRPILLDAPRGAIEAAEIEMTADGHHVEKPAEPIDPRRHIRSDE